MAKKNDKEKKAEQEAAWNPYEIEHYREMAEGMVHFSFKTVNSNAAGGGVRLSGEDALSLPYVSARTLMAHGVRIDQDYTRDVVKANIAKQLRTIFADEQPAVEKTAKMIREACLSASSSRFEDNCGSVSPRLRQLLIPKGDGYVALTPVGAGGLSAIINARVKEHNGRDEKGFVRLRQAQFGIGGANPQNVGGLVREMQRPLFFECPSESREIKLALSIHYKGIPLTIPRELVLEYRGWREAAKARNDGRIPTDMKTRNQEESIMKRFASAVLGRGAWALTVLTRYREDLPEYGESLVSPGVDAVIRGVIDPAERSENWASNVSNRLADQVAAYDFGDDKGGLGLSDSAIAQIAKWIEEGLR
jgi:hypothetical protein